MSFPFSTTVDDLSSDWEWTGGLDTESLCGGVGRGPREFGIEEPLAESRLSMADAEAEEAIEGDHGAGC